MSTTVELGKATTEIARLRAGARSLAEFWADEDEGIEHVAACQNYGCKQCVVIACATDLRALLDES